jgi:very-short-patch-repair endonuclease
LATVNPKLAREWHPTKNSSLTPKDVTPGTDRIAWWLCEKEGHKWQARIQSRNNGRGCPYCSGRYATKENNLQNINPELAREWHPTKNGNLTPKDVTPNSGQSVWWLCKEKGHEWKAIIRNRNHRGDGCICCSGHAVCDDNCLATVNPQLAKEWHLIKNDKLTPKDVLPNSGKKVWWICKRKHEWEAYIYNRNYRGDGCPKCTSKTSQLELRILTEFKFFFRKVIHRKKINGNECDIFVPKLKIGIELDSLYWHKDKLNKDKEKTLFFEKIGISLFRIREKGLKTISQNDIVFTQKESQFEIIKKTLKKLAKQVNLPRDAKVKINEYIKDGRLANNEEYLELLYKLPSPIPGYSLYDKNKILAREWHPTKNGSLTPKDVSPHSSKKVWWLCKKKGHEWPARISHRFDGIGCPGCSGKRATKENNLKKINPGLASEWHPTQNGSLTPKDVTPNSHKKVWWLCKKKGPEWKAIIKNRNHRGDGCPYCSGRRK